MPEKQLSLLLPSVGDISVTAWSLPQDLTKEDWMHAGNMLSSFEGALMWWIGDWWNYAEHAYGDRKALVNGDDWSGPSWDICRAAGTVCTSFEGARRRAVLGFNIHRECVALPKDEADNILDWCESVLSDTGKPPTIKTIRERVRSVKSWLAQGWTTDQLERKALVERGQTVVASKRDDGTGKPRDAALIAWAEQQGLAMEIDRNSSWGNPFVMPEDGQREEVIRLFDMHYLPHKLGLQRKIDGLRGKVLVCWCYPKPCHGDVLAREANT